MPWAKRWTGQGQWIEVSIRKLQSVLPESATDGACRSSTHLRRIEIGEIEEHLSSKAHPALLRGVVDKLETPDIAPSLVAFLDLAPSFSGSSDSRSSSSELQVLPSSSSPDFLSLVETVKSKLAVALPQYMVPRYWLPVNRIPTQGMGKTDRKSLRLLAENYDWKKARAAAREHQKSSSKGLNGSVSHDVQRTEDEWHSAARKAWARVLKLEEEDIGDDDAFTRLGGDSIGFLKVVGKLREAGYRLSFKQLVDATTLADCAAILKSVSMNTTQGHSSGTNKAYETFSLVPADKLDGIMNELETELSVPRSDVEDVYPTAPSQDALLAASVDCTHYYAQAVYALDTSINLAGLQKSVTEMIARYPVLRSCFAVLESSPVTLQIVLRPETEQVQHATKLDMVEVEDDLDFAVDVSPAAFSPVRSTLMIFEHLQAWLKRDRDSHVFRWGRLALAFAVFKSRQGERKLAWSMHHAMR